MWKLPWWALVLVGLSGCQTIFPNGNFGIGDPSPQPRTAGEIESGYTYVPIDPFRVETVPGDGCVDNQQTGHLLDSLPDNAVRMLVERFDASGGVTYGASKSGAKGESYRVTVDYINADTINVRVWIAKSMMNTSTKSWEPVHLHAPPKPEFDPGSALYEVTRDKPKVLDGFPQYSEFNIPVYVGVGLRVSAQVHVIGASAQISGIGIIGAEAEAERIRGSLVVQTLGVNGKSVAAALPIQSELNRTTAQNAIVAVGSIKSLLYADETVKSPRVVGLYLPFPGGKPLVNSLISVLSRQPVKWERSCLVPASASRR